MEDEVNVIVVGDFGEDVEFLEFYVAGVVVLHEEDLYLFGDDDGAFLED